MGSANSQVGVAHAKRARVVLDPRRMNEAHGLTVRVEAQPIEIDRQVKLFGAIPGPRYVEPQGP